MTVPYEIRQRIRVEYKKYDRTRGAVALARKYGVSPRTIYNIIREKKEGLWFLKDM